MKKLIIFLLLFNLLSACESTRDSFSLKKNESDPFSVEKKNPLVMPPNFEDLPQPEDFQSSGKKKNEDEFKQVITTTKSADLEINNEKTSLEKLVIDKIN